MEVKKTVVAGRTQSKSDLLHPRAASGCALAYQHHASGRRAGELAEHHNKMFEDLMSQIELADAHTGHLCHRWKNSQRR